ncbi:response regulator [Desulfobacca acetoxidans]|nr:DNA-binding response regulator [Desulfobacterales bacterium]
MKPSILLIEDDANIRRFLRLTLVTQGYELIEAETGQEGLAQAFARVPDLILLDLGLPDMDGIDIIKQIREWSQVPVIVLSARGQEREKIINLDAGADDYLTKPFGMGELLARIRVVLRRAVPTEEGASETTVRFGKITIDFERRQIWRDQEEIRLSPIEYKLLSTLIKYRDKVVTHRQLLKEVWGPGATEQNIYLRVFILNLRRKLEDDPARPVFLITEPGVGYRLKIEGQPPEFSPGSYLA